MLKEKPDNGADGPGENRFVEQLVLLAASFGLNVALAFLPMVLPERATTPQLCTDSTVQVESVRVNCI
ncbi:hypothetical protein [Nocardia salmonicida]|uniref:hypothetical protein n=1 Tax=Nocardia salmonicida TaxID=53431 RepID=UPI0007A4DB1F|nr:hypothetical protein [Nocardia salmonicida]